MTAEVLKANKISGCPTHDLLAKNLLKERIAAVEEEVQKENLMAAPAAAAPAVLTASPAKSASATTEQGGVPDLASCACVLANPCKLLTRRSSYQRKLLPRKLLRVARNCVLNDA